MASLQTFMQDYDHHLARLEELRELLEERLTAARDVLAGIAVPSQAGPAREQVAAIEAALERMDRGLYGTCRRCSAFIPYEVLLRAPQEQLCAGCGSAGRTERTGRTRSARRAESPLGTEGSARTEGSVRTDAGRAGTAA
jgi:DnaK suppressor protein